MRKFIDLLGSEQQSLLNNETENLLALSEAKTQAASELLEIGKSRRETLLANTADSMETWIAKHAPNSQAVWSNILGLAAQAHHLNSINGELINTKMRHNQQALSVLHNAAKNAASLYGPDGQANINSSGRHLGSG